MFGDKMFAYIQKRKLDFCAAFILNRIKFIAFEDWIMWHGKA